MPNARAAFATLVPISPQPKTDKVREETDICTPERHPSTRTRFWTLDPRADAAEIPFPTDDASDAPTQRMGGPRHPREPGQSEGRRRRERDARGRRSGPLPRACYFGTIYRSDGNAYDASVFEQPGHDGRFGYQDFCARFRKSRWIPSEARRDPKRTVPPWLPTPRASSFAS